MFFLKLMLNNILNSFAAFIDCRDNFLEEVQPEIFQNCHNLTHAFFGHNKINTLHDDLFLNSPRMRTIDFSNKFLIYLHTLRMLIIFCKEFFQIFIKKVTLYIEKQ